MFLANMFMPECSCVPSLKCTWQQLKLDTWPWKHEQVLRFDIEFSGQENAIK